MSSPQLGLGLLLTRHCPRRPNIFLLSYQIKPAFCCYCLPHPNPHFRHPLSIIHLNFYTQQRALLSFTSTIVSWPDISTSQCLDQPSPDRLAESALDDHQQTYSLRTPDLSSPPQDSTLATMYPSPSHLKLRLRMSNPLSKQTRRSSFKRVAIYPHKPRCLAQEFQGTR